VYFVIVPAAFVTDFTPGPRQSGYADRQVRLHHGYNSVQVRGVESLAEGYGSIALQSRIKSKKKIIKKFL
jgi:hypothetical protein